MKPKILPQLLKNGIVVYKAQKKALKYVNEKLEQGTDLKKSIQELSEKIKEDNFIRIYKQFVVAEILENISKQQLVGEVFLMLSKDKQGEIKSQLEDVVGNCFVICNTELNK